MHSIAITILAAATLTSAAPSLNRRGAYYVCYNNGFRGDCSVDPCAISWCPDYKPYTYEPATTTTNTPVTSNPEPPVVNSQSDPTVCAPGTGYFQSCSNGFRGCCKSDACGSTWCPDYIAYTYTPKTAKREPAPAPEPQSDPTVCAPGTGYFQSCSNGFRGCCKGDACGSPTGWCPDAAKPVVKERAPASDPTVCAAGTGYFQSCANGFRGCCKSDACGSAWCADYKPYTYELIGAASVPAPAKEPQTPAPVAGAGGDPTVCAPNTGYYQVCGNGFKGCCKKDACSVGYCPL